jgi:sugar lactone lactonase YvrE
MSQSCGESRAKEVNGIDIARSRRDSRGAPFWMHYRAAARAWGWEQQQAPLGGVLISLGILLAAALPLLARVAVRPWRPRDVALLAAGALVVGGVVLGRSPTAGLFLGIAVVGVVACWRADDASLATAAAMVAAASTIGVATEMVYLWDRMNTVFKYYLDIWLVLGCAACAVTWRTVPMDRAWRTPWIFVLAILATGGLFTTVSGAVGFLRFPPVPSERPTLDGMRYLRQQAPGELEAFSWLNREVAGVRVLVEAHGPSYQRFARVAMNTGLPTPLGWEYHLVQQGRSPERIAERREDLAALLSTSDTAVAARLLTKYHIDLVFVGPLERQTYPARGLAKFDGGSLTETVFRNRDVTIYARPGAIHAANTWIDRIDAAAATVPAGRFSQPRGVARASDGTLLVADFGHKRIQRVATDGTAIVIGREGSGSGEFRDPCGIAVAPDGTFYVADTWNHRIQKFSATGRFLLEWRSGFYGPRGIALDRDDLVYVADTGNHRIVRFAPDGTPRGEWGRQHLREPVGIAVMGDEVYVADGGHRRVVVFSTAGALRRQWPVDGWPPGSLIEPYLAAANDVVWVTDPGGNRVLLYSTTGRFLGTATAEVALDTPLGIAVLGRTRAIVTTRGGTLVAVTRDRAPDREGTARP